MRVMRHGTNMRYWSIGDIHIVTRISPFRIKAAMHAFALWKEILIARQLRISLEVYGHT